MRLPSRADEPFFSGAPGLFTYVGGRQTGAPDATTGPGLISLFCFLMTAAHFLRGGMHAGTVWCVGLAVGLLGRLSPWRMRVRETCTGCMQRAACRDLAISRAGGACRISRRCSLGRDCISRCSRGVPGLGTAGPFSSAPSEREDLYLVTLISAMHAAFLFYSS